jgi:hypothetical protein
MLKTTQLTGIRVTVPKLRTRVKNQEAKKANYLDIISTLKETLLDLNSEFAHQIIVLRPSMDSPPRGASKSFFPSKTEQV